MFTKDTFVSAFLRCYSNRNIRRDQNDLIVHHFQLSCNFVKLSVEIRFNCVQLEYLKC